MNDLLSPLIKALHGEGRIRVWSLVITIFGDVVLHRGGRVASRRLRYLLQHIRVEPGALRTALSRLTRDGWVERTRDGRNTHYSLSLMGEREFGPALARVYAPPRPAPVTRWSLALGSGRPEQDALPVGSGVWLIPEGAGSLPGYLVVAGTLGDLPAGFAGRIVTPDHHAALAAMYRDAEQAGRLAASGPGGLDAMAARILLIHRWRRLVLKYPDVPPELMPPTLPRTDLRRLVAETYRALLPASEAWLDSSVPDTGPMPAADPGLARRFAAVG